MDGERFYPFLISDCNQQVRDLQVQLRFWSKMEKPQEAIKMIYDAVMANT